MAVKSLTAGAFVAALLAMAAPAVAATHAAEPKDVEFSFEGPLGKFDRAALQRGFKVYQEVCSACHSMNLVYYRNLAQKGGPFYDPKQPNPNNSPYAKAIAAEAMVPDIDPDTGDAVMRAATPADHLRAPFANEAAARAANGGALPPDLSVIAKAREGGPAYIYSLLTGYAPPPKGLTVAPGQYYNPYIPGDLGAAWSGPKDKVPVGGVLAMPFQLPPDRVSFDDGTKSTSAQEAHDVVTFLAWASEPHQEERKQAGIGVMAYLLIFAGIMYVSYRRIWRNVAH
ncbi:MAG TPA: cytochrome c1 [Caulobacteraceae bacterium]|jgi:ubiquinol-cytochrome c reductase cytochrome c1 subunit|nr:cytochrome c1 [Caulobacteraceae bacterium]